MNMLDYDEGDAPGTWEGATTEARRLWKKDEIVLVVGGRRGQ